jgi:hypothetical protein
MMLSRCATASILALTVSWLASTTRAIEYNGHLYFLTPDRTSWELAEADAIAIGGHLITINDPAENTFLVDSFLTVPPPGEVLRPLWIGINDATTEGTFVWSSGEASSYTNWHGSEPNNFGGNEHYATIGWHFARFGGATARNTWNDTPLLGTTGFGGTSDGPYQGIIENPPSEPALAGDYNEDGIVDAADYVVWRKGLGTLYIQAQYDVWRANFGQTAGGGTALRSADTLSTAVPEPITLAPLLLTAAGWWLRRRRLRNEVQ